MLEVRNLSIAYGDIRVLWGISLEVKKGEIVTLVGSNGAGKTTTLRTISGILRPLDGEVTFEGEPLRGNLPHRNVELGIAHIPEGRRLFPDMTVIENLEMGSYPAAARPFRRQTLRWIYELFPRLADRRQQMVGSMSGGEQQMVAIGRGLMARPKLLLIDEPSFGLAPKLVTEIFRVIKEIQGNGVTVLLVEQNVRSALEIAQRAYIMETGRITRVGPSKEMLEDDDVRRAYLGL
ncbi:MAG: ABC transporter ATP-binding protein [Candidatus Tectomicrobia bacterium]|nr:ABC transporter ATP-binding protein [Candidatus Tectomicrobia bacterium]